MVFIAMCISILLYGLESLPLTAARMRYLDSFAYLSLRSILGYKYYDRISYQHIVDKCKEDGINFSWPSEMLTRRRRKDFWHFFRHHTDYAMLGIDPSKKVISRVRTLDQIVCKEEGIETKDLLVLSRDPAVTRGKENIALAVTEIKKKEKEAAELQRQLNLQAFYANQEQLKKERDRLLSEKKYYDLLGESELYKSRLQELKAKIF